jgi:hypothetical protein
MPTNHDGIHPAETDLHANQFAEDNANVSFMAGRKSVDNADDLAAPYHSSSFKAKTSGIRPAVSSSTGSTLAIKARKRNTETSGNPMTNGVSKETIGVNKSDPGRGLASAVREINSDDSRVISEPALKTATKALQGQRDITQRAPSLNLKAQAALKGGGGEGETNKLESEGSTADIGSTQEELNKTRKAMKGFSIVPEGF